MQAFEGIRVLDLTHVLAGPFATYQLAVMGADVIKIEDPNEPDMMRPEGVSPALNAEGRGTRFISQCGNKRCITLDLKTEAGRAIILKMVETTDVVVSNFRSDVMHRLGLDADRLQAINPQLIYCAMSGFGATGPKAQHPAYDNVIQAYSGLLAATGHLGGEPVKVGPAVLDYGTGAQAAFAIASALFQRTRTGMGQRIDVSMLDAALMLMSSTVCDAHVRGGPPEPHGNTDPRKAAYGLFETADGQLMVGAFTNTQLARVFTSVGRKDKADAMQGLSMEDVDAIAADDRALLQEIFLTDTANAWEEKLNAGGAPAARVRDIYEAMGSAQVQSRRSLQSGVSAPEKGSATRTPVAAFDYATHGPELTREAPLHGADTDAVLAEFGYSTTDIEGLRKSGVI